MPKSLRLPAFAKINLDLRVLGTRADGYHDLRTIFQSLALHDVLTFTRRPGPFAIECDDPQLPTDRRNLIWKAASLLWRTVGRRGGDMPSDVLVHLAKRVPREAGLGGGSADAAATLVALSDLWKLDVDSPTISRLAARLGADVPFFLVGGTALGLGRGDDIYPLSDLPRSHVVIVRPPFGVSTLDAYGWYDAEAGSRARTRAQREPPRRLLPDGWPEWAVSLRNDLESVVASHHPTIQRIKSALVDAGAVHAAMSGSGSAVFGLFDRADAARRTAADLGMPGRGRAAAAHGWQVFATRTLSRVEYARKLHPQVVTGR